MNWHARCCRRLHRSAAGRGVPGPSSPDPFRVSACRGINQKRGELAGEIRLAPQTGFDSQPLGTTRLNWRGIHRIPRGGNGFYVTRAARSAPAHILMGSGTNAAEKRAMKASVVNLVPLWKTPRCSTPLRSAFPTVIYSCRYSPVSVGEAEHQSCRPDGLHTSHPGGSGTIAVSVVAPPSWYGAMTRYCRESTTPD
jgi:hypothetical protein